MKIAFRVDASKQIGTGHVVRCLTLAAELKKKNAEIYFYSQQMPDEIVCTIKDYGYSFVRLSIKSSPDPSKKLEHYAWLESSQEQDADAFIDALSGQKFDWFIVDHYALDEQWEKKVSSFAQKLLVIDDLADRTHDCDLLLDQNYYLDLNNRYDGKTPERCKLLLGLSYALLRNEFSRFHQKILPRTGRINRVLIFFGGIDAMNYTFFAINALQRLKQSFNVDVVIGSQHPKLNEIQEACNSAGYRCHIDTSSMAELMGMADLAIGAGGTATWERCCLGLPALVFGAASNQSKLIRDAAKKNYLYAPDCKLVSSDVIYRHLICLIENPWLLENISRSSLGAVDGLGATRVVAEMGFKDIRLRKALKDDSINLFNWRNNPKIRLFSQSKEVIAWKDHCLWLDGVLLSKNHELLIGSILDEDVGVVRFDIKNEYADISIYRVPDKKFSGLGKSLLASAEEWLRINRPEVRRIQALVFDENEASKNLFQGCGYKKSMMVYEKGLSKKG